MARVDTIDIKNFRNHKHIRIDFKKGINVIWGENGSGKTAILEAIYALSMGRSFRTRAHKETLREGSEGLTIKGVFIGNEQKQEVVLHQLLNGQRKFTINNNDRVSAKELIGQNPIVILSPEEQSITKGSPTDRRSYFDKTLSIVSTEYLNTFLIYQRALKQRNTAIRELRLARAGKDSIIAWNEALLANGNKLWYLRDGLMGSFIDELTNATDRYNSKNAELKLIYKPEGKAETYEIRLEKSLNSDINKGWTTVGPHRDNYTFSFNGRSLREFGSQGEHKLALVLIKMAEITMIKEKTEKTPVLMLDDLFAKLDFKRADDVLTLMSKGGQTIITTTDIVDFEKHGLDMNSKENSTHYLERECKD